MCIFNCTMQCIISVANRVSLRWLGNAGMFDNSFSQISPSKHVQILVRINRSYKHQVKYSSCASVSAGSSVS